MTDRLFHGDGRISARIATRVKRAPDPRAPRMTFDAAKAKRRLSNWRASNASLRALMASEGAAVLGRCRDVVRNNPYAAGASEIFVANTVGAGIKPSSLLEDAGLRDQVMRLWLQWTDECDADGLVDLYGMQAAAARALFEAGEVFIRLRPRLAVDGLSVPLQLQMLESEMLDHGFNETLDSGNEIISGVEFDRIGRRVAYHFWRRHPGDGASTFDGRDERTRVPAESVLHIFRVARPGQVRGVPMMAATVVKLWLLDQYDDAELERKKTAAMFAGFITSPTPDEVFEEDEDFTGDSASKVVSLEPGTMHQLFPGESIEFAQPADVGGSYEAFQYRSLLAIFTGLGIPYTIGTGDLKRANYSSLRGALVEFRRRIQQLQHHTIVFQACRPIWNAWFDAAVLSGALRIAGYGDAPAQWRCARWIAPKFEWVDPFKDLKAEALAVQYGFKARSDVIEAEGYDPEETDRRIAADTQRAKDLGIVISNNPVPLDEEQADAVEEQLDDAADTGGSAA